MAENQDFVIDLAPLECDQLKQVLTFLETYASEGPFKPELVDSLSKSPVRAFRDIRQNKNAGPLRSVLSSLCHRWNVVALRETPYRDGEFWDSHAGLYERCFVQYPVDCERLHFFSCPPEGAVPGFAARLCAAFIEGLAWKQILGAFPQTEYRGYCVLRPVPSCNVSRTAVTFDERPISSPPLPNCVEFLPDEEDGCPVLAVYQDCPVHLLNAQLTVRSPEFIQQDPHLGACATASLWVATRRISTGDASVSKFPFSAITNQAIGAWTMQTAPNVGWDPTAGDAGFSVDQVKNAVTQCGWHCVEAAPIRGTLEAQSERLRFTIMSYLDSGFPALLFLTPRQGSLGHVVATVGYCLPGKVNLASLLPFRQQILEDKDGVGIDDRHFVVSGAVKVFYAHDDAYGPFNRVWYPSAQEQRDEADRLLKESLPDASLQELERFTALIEARRHAENKRPWVRRSRVGPEDMWLASALIPVPTDVRADVNGVLIKAIQRFTGDEDYATKVSKVRDPRFFWRCVLTKGADFKGTLGRRGYAEELRKWYATLHLPRYVWVVEVSMFPQDELSELFPAKGEWLVDGEFLYDATAPYYDSHWIAGRVLRQCSDWRDGPSGVWRKKTESSDGISVQRFRVHTEED
jgi:hypothetical protein